MIQCATLPDFKAAFMKHEVTSRKPKYIMLLAIIFGILITIARVITIHRANDVYLSIFSATVCVLMIREFRLTRSLSYDEEFVYLSTFRHEQAIPYPEIVEVKTLPMSFVSVGFSLHAGHKIAFIDGDGKKKRFKFYVSGRKESEFDNFTRLLAAKNLKTKIWVW
jgi:hypothetical protein